MSFKIKKEALEKVIQDMIDEISKADDWFDEQRITIHCGNAIEVQVVVTNDEDNFIGEVFSEYKEAA